MRPLSLDLRGPADGLALSQEPAVRAAGTSFLMHGLAVGALAITPLLRATEPPKPAVALLDPLVTPIRVALPPPPMVVSLTPRKAGQPQPDRGLVPPVDVPALIPAFPIPDLLDPVIEAGTLGPGGTGPGSEAGICWPGSICGIAEPPMNEAMPPMTPRVGGLIKEPRLAASRPPQYPAVAQAAGVSGKVVIEAHVGRDGLVKEHRVVEGHRLFDDAALASVRSRRYEPLLLNGVPSDFLVTITIEFNLRR